ncbi:GntR family transcriptional regulator [Ammoniphilus resinae]|uniref:DNA-binding GntR family transcriptional regulator n=1 Tax=Ammoniphilus resinae TaxID=861532 RepID=A0ABS4GLB9_9BACL|nr:DNA-binding GntR family transcriptional regulator [Ammoniphilus resinae]
MENQQIKKEFVFERLHEMIVNGYFRPGESLSEREIAERFGVSRTPVREAFRKMEKDGIVLYEPKKGVTIPSFSTEEIVKLYDVREYLEGLAARLLAEKKNEQAVSELRKNIEQAEKAAKENDGKWQAVINGHFHLMILEGSENPYLLHAYQGLRSKISLMRSTSLSFQDRLITNLQDHRQIYDAIAHGDASRAEEAARQHVRNSMKSTLSKLRTESKSKYYYG